jgi:hypothetical protein
MAIYASIIKKMSVIRSTYYINDKILCSRSNNVDLIMTNFVNSFDGQIRTYLNVKRKSKVVPVLN